MEMGGLHLQIPGIDTSFLINNEQSFYLVKHNHIDCPEGSEFDISERNTTDTLARCVMVFGVLRLCSLWLGDEVRIGC
jgi:hypothetical protein